ncbi:MAG: hypothetical protein R3C14_50680 [Caldilineaceae bacterium]
MNTLFFEKLSRFDRAAEPVTVSIPFAAGQLVDPAQLTLYDDEQPLPVQRQVLATWEDGSVKWLLVHCQPDLPGNRAKTLTFAINEQPTPPTPVVTVSATESAAGITVNTGPLTFLAPRSGFLPLCQVQLEGKLLWTEQPWQGFTLQVDGELYHSTHAPLELTVEENGPLRVVITAKGQHRRDDGEGYLELHGRITAYAGKPYVEVEHQFIHTEEAAAVQLEGLTLSFEPHWHGPVKLALGEGYYRTAIQESDELVELELNAETMLYQANEHFIDSYYGDFWADWRNEQGGVTLSVYQAHQNFPKALYANAEGLTCFLMPADAPSIRILQGMGKTHRLQLHFHGPTTPLQECSVRSLQFQLPDRPALSRAWLQANNPWRENFFPERLPGRLITLLNSLHDGRPKALGMMHFGDAPDANYTNQGRGRGETVWVNNEYDRPHCCTLFYGLTGQRRVLDSALVGARHWLDVDLCHYHPDPLINGGLKIHTAYHGTGRVTPSHEWTEGFLDYYFLTGRQEGLVGARSVAENIMRHMARPELREPGQTAVREGGWALRAMVCMWLGTGETKWRTEAERIVAMFLAWHEEYGALLAPYTSHTMPRVPFMIALTVNSFARYLLIEEDERVKRLIVAVVDDLIAHCLGADGIFFYKELPSLQRTAPTPHVLEALTYAYRITGQVDYLKLAARQFAALAAQPTGGGGGTKYVDASGAVIAGQGGGRIFADKYTSILIFAAAAAPLGLLDWFEYPYANLG